MTRIRAVILALGLLALTACTPLERSAWAEWFNRDPAPATLNLLALQPPTPTACSQWYGEALAAGWDSTQWSTLSYIMWRESNCRPDVQNPSGATGLIQVMPMWADDCGTTPTGLFDPLTNLRCGRHILDVQGWTAWSTY